jgi:murein DD-endopeptidase MepM/ murein hydrolase activator NlpD
MIAAGVIFTSVLSPAIPGSASSAMTGDSAATRDIDSASQVAASFNQSSAERQTLEKPLAATQPPGDNLLMAVLSLEASTTSAEVAASMQRILDLGVSQSPALTAVEPTPELEEAAVEATATATPEPEDGAETDEETACDPAGATAYCIYTVAEGDTLSGIAETVGFAGNESISAAEMLAQSNKPDIVSSDHIEPGFNIRIPRGSGILHTVLFSETASEIAADYGVSLEDLLGSPYNGIGSDGIVVIGQEVFVPNPAQLPVNEDVELTIDDPEGDESGAEESPQPTEAPTEEPTLTEIPQEPTETPEPVVPPDIPALGPLDTPTPTAEPTEEPTSTPEPEDEDEEPKPQPRSRSGEGLFVWPAEGPISSYFGPSHPLGIDIDLYDNPNAPIVASRGGTVVYAGGDPCCSYGYYVIIEHENGVQTLYAHLSRIRVSEGETVSQGETIGTGGKTGNATGNHLHFEIRVDGNVVDPLKYLP